jgi:hypothetical protein
MPKLQHFFFLTQLFLTSAGILLADGRVIHFPTDRAVGVVYSGAAVDGSYYEVNYREWKKLGEAKGEIAIEADQHVRLQVSSAASSDLSFLQQIDPNGIQLLFLRDTHVSDEQLRFIGRLTDLRMLDLRHCRITDAGIEHLRLHDQYHGKGLTILGVHTTAASENMEQFVRDHAIRWAVAHDVDNVTRRSWKTDSFPSNFLVDRNGLIRHADVRAEDLDRHVATLLDNEE